jgi:HdeA/HdeB family
MRPRFILAIAAIALQTLCLGAGAQAQEELPCDAFAKNSDGSWTATRAAFILGPNFSVRAGGVFRPGEKFNGYDLAAKLDEACRSVTAAPPAATAQPRQGQVPLSEIVDANGNIDIQRLKCGHLADASGEEAELFLAWYSGSHNRSATKRAIKMTSLHLAILNIVDYCRANRDKGLIKVMDLMLK